MGHRSRLLLGVLAGFASWLAIGGAGLWILRTSWPEYALAEPDKSYTLAMLFARLTVGVICTLSAGWITTVASQGKTGAAWWLGAVLLLISAKVHFLDVWADYPPWYHFAYLLPLMPLTAAGGFLARRRRQGSRAGVRLGPHPTARLR